VECKRFLKLDSAWLLGYAPATMIKSALQKNADLYICHAEWGALIGKALIEKGCRVAYDIEDWYSRDYLVPTRPVRLLEKLETFALAKGRYCSCPSNSMADALALTYRSKKPSVIYNGFSDVDTPDLELMSSYKSPSFVWFSQTIGPGRGLEILTEILRHYDRPVEVHLIGDCVEGYEEQLKNVFPFAKGHQLIFHPSVPHHQLLKEVAKYQIGLALELSYPDNKNTTVSNKMLQYVQAGIKILASDTKGQSEIAAFIPSSVELISLSDKDKWLQALDNLIDRDYDHALQRNIFLTHFSWEAQEKKLLSLVSAALLN
jgi:glycosyltransferase involved in cell wall biosynthesis